MFMRVTLVSCVACVLMVGNLHAQSRMAADPNIVDQLPVSYTHLTLPTIYSV